MSTIKRLLLCVSLLLTSSLTSNVPPYQLIPYTNAYGQYVVYFVNNTNRTVYCSITGQNYFIDTYVYPNSRSGLDYIHPPGQVNVHWTWGCR